MKTLATLANTCMFECVCKCLQVFASVWQGLQVLAIVWKCLQVFSYAHKCLQLFAIAWKWLQVFTSVYMCLQVFACVCKNLECLVGPFINFGWWLFLKLLPTPTWSFEGVKYYSKSLFWNSDILFRHPPTPMTCHYF